jgi:branched-chain amino acid transport system permease protein
MTTVWSGLTVGSVYALVAVAYTIVFLPTGVFNFAQAQYLMIGTFVAYGCTLVFGVAPVLSVLIGIAVGALLSILEEVVAIRPLLGQGRHGELITTLGFAVMLDGVVALVYGDDPRTVPFFGPSNPLSVLGGRLLPQDLALIGVAILAALGTQLFLRRTMIGLASLASAEDRVAALLRGINGRALSIGAFVLAGSLCVAVGPIVAPQTFATSALGDSLAIQGFVAVAIGGFGSPTGSLVGGFVTGLTEAFTARYLGIFAQSSAVFILLLAVLMVRPTGLFGEREQRTI